MSSRTSPSFFHNRWHRWLVVFFVLWWLALAVAPLHRFDWFLENLLVAATVLAMWRAYPNMRFSNEALTAMTVFLSLHVLGSHYTYAETPVGFWMQDIFGWSRNHYDRFIHFCFGLLMFWTLREAAQQTMTLKSKWTDTAALLVIIAMSAFYEVIEWMTTKIVNSEAADVFLGTQGDFFDSQKDHGLAILGVLLSFSLAKILKRLGRLPRLV